MKLKSVMVGRYKFLDNESRRLKVISFLGWIDRVENVGVRVTPHRPFNEERPSS